MAAIALAAIHNTYLIVLLAYKAEEGVRRWSRLLGRAPKDGMQEQRLNGRHKKGNETVGG